ncbi:SLAM family member 9-like [Pempheris klunzingeri]|uniref:SLAM family member 9-like n=1 Tax=Pempheris klunzingeri TaxID=3127111 RepID=UPI00397EA63F
METLLYHFLVCWPLVLLFALSLLYSYETHGTSSVTPVFVQTGEELSLDVKKQVDREEDSDFIWQLNGSMNIVKLSDSNRIRVHKNYAGRADISLQNYTLFLRDVQKDDSGDYSAHVSGDQVQIVAKYKVIVQDPVSPVELTVNSSISGSCNVTVTCTSVDSHISSTFRCDNQTCSKEEGDKSEAHLASIHVYLEQGFFICNHSNLVSWKQDRKEVKSICVPHLPHPVSNGATTNVIWTGVAIVSLPTALCLFLFIKYKRKNYGNTIYAVPQDIKPDQNLNQSLTEDASEFTGTTSTSSPHTVYAQVFRAAKSNYRPPQPTEC